MDPKLPPNDFQSEVDKERSQFALFKDLTPAEMQTGLTDAIKVLPQGSLPEKIDTGITTQQFNRIIARIVFSLSLTTVKQAIILVSLLFLKGAANAGAPKSLSSTLYLSPNEKVSLSKEDLMQAYKMECRNNHIRRLAEYMATTISLFAQNNNLNGDIVGRITALIGPGDTPLSPGEKAWCNSFNQKNPKCMEVHPRVATLLSVEYHKKFTKSERGPQVPKIKGPPRKKGQGNKNRNQQRGK